jgi:hypothetical protein
MEISIRVQNSDPLSYSPSILANLLAQSKSLKVSISFYAWGKDTSKVLCAFRALVPHCLRWHEFKLSISPNQEDIVTKMLRTLTAPSLRHFSLRGRIAQSDAVIGELLCSSTTARLAPNLTRLTLSRVVSVDRFNLNWARIAILDLWKCPLMDILTLVPMVMRPGTAHTRKSAILYCTVGPVLGNQI